MELGTGTVRTVVEAGVNSAMQLASEIRIWDGSYYDCYREIGADSGAVLDTGALSGGEEHTAAVGNTAEETETPAETPNIAWPAEMPAE